MEYLNFDLLKLVFTILASIPLAFMAVWCVARLFWTVRHYCLRVFYALDLMWWHGKHLVQHLMVDAKYLAERGTHLTRYQRLKSFLGYAHGDFKCVRRSYLEDVAYRKRLYRGYAEIDAQHRAKYPFCP